ncbi:ATP-binding cassette domain-containing protein [bacterium]|nr:ATP-binding cassette domain-containing protein [bacterium]
MNIIETNGLCKRYGSFTAVNNLHLQVAEGSIYGFLGLNGAGKTTTMRMLLNMIKPNSGSVSLFGQTKQDHAVWKKVGYAIESAYAYPNLSVHENLEISYQYHQMKNRSAIDEIIGELDLGAYVNTRAGALSLGNKQRLSLAKAMLHKPALLILDEPVNGLDPAGIVDIRNYLKKLSQNGTTILISSHLLGEISKIADTIGIIHHGKMVCELDAQKLDDSLEKHLVLCCSPLDGARQLLENKGIREVEIIDKQIIIRDKLWLQQPEKLAKLLVENSFELSQLYTYVQDLEHYFLQLVNNN